MNLIKKFNLYWVATILGACQTNTTGISRNSLIILSDSLNYQRSEYEKQKRFGKIPFIEPGTVKKLLKLMEREKLIYSFINPKKQRVYRIASKGQQVLLDNNMFNEEHESTISKLTDRIDKIEESNPESRSNIVKMIKGKK